MTVSTVDGLGFEEIGQPGSQISNVWVVGSVVSQSLISGAQIFSTGSVLGARICDANGKITSTNMGSPATYGYRIQSGFVTTGAGSSADINLGISYTAIPYVVTFGASGNAVVGTPTVSGVQTVSGCTIIGTASTVYGYIAVGPA